MLTRKRLSFFACMFLLGSCFAQAPKAKPVTDDKDPVLAKLYAADGPYSRFNAASELVNLRTESSKHFKNEDSTYTTVLTAGNCHYKEGGVWKTSANTVAATGNTQYPYANTHNLVKTYYGNLQQGVKFRWPAGTEVSGFAPVDIYATDEKGMKIAGLFQPQAVAPLANNNKVVYQQITPSVNYTIEQLTGQVQTTYTITNNIFQNAPANTEDVVFAEKINLPAGCTVSKGKDERNDKQVIKVMQGDKLLFTYSDVYYFDDSTGKMKPVHEAATFDYTMQGQVLQINIHVPYRWLTNPATKYPVTIDPSVNVTPANSTYWTGTNVNTGGADNLIATGFYDCSGCTDEDYHGYVKFDISSLPDYACVTATELYMYQNAWVDGGGDNGCQFDVGWANVEPVSAAWSTIYNAVNGLAERYVRWDVWGTPGACGGCSGGYDYPESPNGWKGFNLSGNSAIRSRIKSTTTQDYITIGLDMTYHASDCYWCWGDETNWLRWDGYSSGSRPYLAITYNNAAAATTWTGAINTDWFNNGNWTNCVPASNTDVTIPNTTNKPYIGSGYTGYCNTISIASDNGARLDLAGNLQITQ